MIQFPSFHGDLDLAGKHVLVTGGAGFIGSHLTDYLVQHGAAHIRVADNLSTGSVSNLAHHLESGAIEFLELDLSVRNNCLKVAEGMHFIFHQAALGSIPRSVNNPDATHEANVNGFFHMLEAARKCGAERFIYASSSSVYGDNISFPRPETKLGNPLSPYAVSKRINELYGEVYHRVYGLHTTGLRYFNIFGPRQDPQGPYAAAIPKFIMKMASGEAPVIFGDGEQTRDFTFVANAIQANILAAASPGAAGEVFNIGMGSENKVIDLVKVLGTFIPEAPEPLFEPPRKGDVIRSKAEIDKAMDRLGYTPAVSLSEGIHITVDWFLHNHK